MNIHIRKNEKLKVEENIIKGEMWLGMSKEQLISMKGQPVKKTRLFQELKDRNTTMTTVRMNTEMPYRLLEGYFNQWKDRKMHYSLKDYF